VGGAPALAPDRAAAALTMGYVHVAPPAAPLAWPEIVGPDDFGGHLSAELAGQVNLDYAATTPALRASVDAVLRVLPAYGSVHRGGGARSRITTAAYESARTAVARFVDCDDEHVVVFVRNTTEAINLASASLLPNSRVLCSPLEHHANLLPWRDHDVEHLPFTRSAEGLVDAAADALERAARGSRPFDVLAVCGASNVTGELLPIAELASLAHDWGTRILVDAAQLAPHRSVSVRQLDVDFLAMSGHKLYAPFGCGVLVVRREVLAAVPPLLKGGGAVRVVTLDDVAWAEVPHRLEAGTPNVLGAVALAAACDTLAGQGMAGLEERERELADRLWRGLDALPACRTLRAWSHTADRLAVATFTVTGIESRDVAQALARDHGVAVRSGLFCAHPLVSHLLGTEAEAAELLRRVRTGDDVALPGAVRASVGIGVEPEHIDRLLDGLAEITQTPARGRPSGTPPRVDLHRHVWPDELVRLLAARTAPPFLSDDTLVTSEGRFTIDVDALSDEHCRAELDRDRLDVAVVSLQPTLGISTLPDDEAAVLHDAYNAGVERLIAAAGGRLRAFSAGGVRPGFAGLCVAAGELLDLTRLELVLDELSAQGQILFVHPGPARAVGRTPDWWAPAIDYTAQMQAAYGAWLAEGALRWPELPAVFAILAGGAPFQLERLRSRGVDTRCLTAANVHLDTASYGRLSLELCLAAYGVGHLVYGSDAPVIDAGSTLAAINALGKATADAICRHNPAALLAA